MNITIMVLVISFLFLALFDVYIIIKKGKRASISAHVINGSKKYPLVVLLFGIILGHCFWSMDSFDYLSRDILIKRCKEVIE